MFGGARGVAGGRSGGDGDDDGAGWGGALIPS